MKSFLKMLLATIIGGALLMFIIFIVFASLISVSTPKLEVKENTILKIDLNTSIVDRAQKNPFSSFDPLSGEPESALGLNAALGALNAAKNDAKIIGVYLDGGIPLGNAATATELRDAIINFRESGKFVYGYTEILSQKGYYLASAADSFFVNPEGAIEWIGLSASVTYYKEALDKMGVKPEVLRATGNKFKSAVEPYLTQNMSDENRMQMNELINSVWESYTEDIASSTGISVEKLNEIADSLNATSPKKAAELGLIADAIYQDQVDSIVSARAGVSSISDVSFLNIKEYAKGYDITGNKDFHSDKIALVIAQGGIQGGEGDEYTIGSERIARAIRKARKNSSVKAIILRVNSPGGSALASEVIWREVALARKEKPVIASMGGLAASGGYYISCFADTIVAQPNTITGSIGAFGLFFTAEELLTNKLGVNIETVNTNTYSDLGTLDRALSAGERRLLIRQIDEIYGTFKERVAEGRGIDVDSVETLGQGRVYSGADALELGLVDVLGGMETAVEIAANKAGLEEYRIVEYPEPKDPFEDLMKQLTEGFQTRIINKELGQYAPYLNILKKMEDMQGLQTRLEYDIIID